MTPAGTALLAKLETAAAAAKEAESALHKRMAREIARAERDRGFAYRRLNLLRAVIDAVAPAKDEQTAVAYGMAILRTELGWESDSESRTDTVSRFAPVVRVTYAGLSPEEAEKDPEAEVAKSLADFEAWYEQTYERPFWVLFDREMEVLPLVER